MRKITFFLTLLLAFAGVTTAGAQICKPTVRATNLKNGETYMLYNTAFNNNEDRTGFLYDNGSEITHSGLPKKKPYNPLLLDKRYLWEIVSTGGACEYHLKSISNKSYVGTDGSTNNSEPQNLYIQPWKDTQAPTAGVRSEASDGTIIEASNSGNFDNVFTICGTGLTSNGLSNGGGDCWNGNPNQWVKWGSSHPWAFYETEEVISAEDVEKFETITGEIESLIWAAQTAYGLVTDATKYSSNAVHPSEGSLAALLDNDYTSYFHSRYRYNIGDYHYLQADLTQETKNIRFFFKKRSDNNNNRPTVIDIQGSTDGQKFTSIQKIEEGLPTDASVIDYVSAKITSETPYRYFRFVVENTNTGNKDTDGLDNNTADGHVFFTFSEFYIWPGENETINNVCDVYNGIPTLSYEDEDFKEKLEPIFEKFNSAKEELAKHIAIYKFNVALTEAQRYKGFIGEKLHKYSQHDDDEDFETALTQAEEFFEGIENEQETDIDEWTSRLNTLVEHLSINQPVPGKFYRFRSATDSNRYMTSTITLFNNNERLKMETEGSSKNGAPTVFYLDDENRLVAFSNGLCVGKFIQGNERDSWKCVQKTNDKVGTAEFKGSGTVGQYNICMSEGRYLHNKNATVDCGGSDGDGYRWIIEEVTWLPVPINESIGWGTLYSPVELSRFDDRSNERVKAYTGNFVENKSEIERNDITGNIPANTAVVIELMEKEGMANDCVYLPIVNSSEVAGNGNFFQGKIYAEAKSTDKITYTLQSWEESKEVGFGMYTGTTLSGFKAYIELENTGDETMSAPQTLRMVFGGTATGIAGAATADAQKADTIYDLSGRRVAKPAKGLYIVNGQKVIFK